MRYAEWLQAVADELGVEPQDVVDAFYQVRELLYDAKASPKEAADFIRLYG